MTSHRFLKTTAAASAIALLFVSDAFADVSADAVLAGLQRQFTLQGSELTVDSAELTGGDDVLLSGVTIKAPSGEEAFKLEQILLEDVSEADGGAFLVGRVATPAISRDVEGYVFALEGIEVAGYLIAGPDEQDPIIKGGIYRAMSVGKLAVAKGDTPVFTLEGATATMTPYEAGGAMETEFEVKDFAIDFNQVEDPKARAAMTELGYGTMTGRMSGSGSWNTAGGKVTWQQAVDLDDAATLNIDMALGGWTPELIAALQALNTQMDGQNDQAMGLAALGVMQQVQIDRFTLEVVDDSATGRILDFVAKQQGTNPASIVAQAKGVLPMLLAQLQNPDFAASASAAIGAYLDNPGSLKVALAPANPVPVVQIMGAAMAAPQSLIGVLGVKVTANE